MSKSKKASKRKRDVQIHEPNKKREPASPGPTHESDVAVHKPKTLSAVVSPEEVEITVDTLQTLAEYPSVIKSKGCKNLRAAVYDFRQACTTGTNTGSVNGGDHTNLTARVSAALVDGKYTDALVLLAEMRIRDEAPKLGALCRWVRDLDVTSGLSQTDDDSSSSPRSQSRPELLRVLDAISRVTGTVETKPTIGPCLASSDPIAVQTLWDLRDSSVARIPIVDSVADGSISQSCPPGLKENFRAIETTPGAQRKPPNAHPAVLYLSSDNAVPLSPTPPQITRHEHPAVPHLSLMKDVFSKEECKSIVASMESIGFLPDAPIRDDGDVSSILAHNVYWIIDQAFHDTLWGRVSPHIPAHIGGKKARGINRRFRVYRYVPGAEYRVHFDGAWPPSGFHAETGKYLYDASPRDAKQSSLFTFLVYLNDDFEGGETTFFTPSIRDRVLNAHPVRPTMGSVALFPHGESKGALLHEGTGVRKGAKYIIRTDVEFDVDPASV
ncbi:hypothetical protein SLS62_004066 [Diatrype stigma]|uniref:Fe2OG dioxygenase domain-containing protein n=1 Tax=Diatrype stigma TaxID=117547 RepID=A0AAN9UVI9_9PEZI